MTRWTDHDDIERKVMLQQVADKEGLPEYAVEKDWWVTMVLKALFRTKYSEWLEFKGGTSLSKGWQLIDRFSEDIDLALNHTFFIRDSTKYNLTRFDITSIDDKPLYRIIGYAVK